MKTGFALLACLALLMTAMTSDVQARGGYRSPPPPPPPPPPPTRYAPPVTSSPSRVPSAPPPSSTFRSTTPPSSKSSTSSSTASTTDGRSRTSADYAKQSAPELQKTIGAQTKQIDTYRARVNNPASYPNWNSFSRERQSALLSQWNAEIRRLEGSRATAQRALSQRPR